MGRDASIESFEKLGFTRVEAEVYIHLVQNSPATGYGIAKAINRTKGAIYNVLASLESKGSVVIDEGEGGRLYRAVPPEELLDQMERRFRQETRRAIEAAKELHPNPVDERIYRLTTVEQVYGRCRKMLEASRMVAFLDLHPRAVAELREDIQRTVDRGVKVGMEIYKEEEFSGAWTTVSSTSEEVLDRFPVNFIYVCVDGTQQMVAALSEEGDRVYHASWTENLLLSWVQLSYVARNVLASTLVQLIESGSSIEELRAICKRWEEFLPNFTSPGYVGLTKRYGLRKVGSAKHNSG